MRSACPVEYLHADSGRNRRAMHRTSVSLLALVNAGSCEEVTEPFIEYCAMSHSRAPRLPCATCSSYGWGLCTVPPGFALKVDVASGELSLLHRVTMTRKVTECVAYDEVTYDCRFSQDVTAMLVAARIV